AARQGSSRVVPPLCRQDLADFLCVDRSAMTRCLYQMQDEGILSIEGRAIRLNSPRDQMEKVPASG
ncbi:MAG: Crp/Fnr family transcriptional regulator, partial [Clostridia bacterium]|nr:Crp/Fnr family transcriptional regulator [Clostridia bacterium]